MSDSTEGKDQHEPSMEEILASIRRIISEEAEGGAETEAAAAPKADATAPAPAAPPPAAERPKRPPIADVESEDDDDESDVLLLTEEAADEASPVREVVPGPEPKHDDETPPEPAQREPEALTFEPEPESLADAASVREAPMSAVDRLLSDRAAAASLAAMSELVSRRHREPKIENLSMGNANQTLEDLTRELLRPILKAWLDDNLPQIVERIVREEIGRLAVDAQRR